MIYRNHGQVGGTEVIKSLADSQKIILLISYDDKECVLKVQTSHIKDELERYREINEFEEIKDNVVRLYGGETIDILNIIEREEPIPIRSLDGSVMFTISKENCNMHYERMSFSARDIRERVNPFVRNIPFNQRPIIRKDITYMAIEYIPNGYWWKDIMLVDQRKICEALTKFIQTLYFLERCAF